MISFYSEVCSHCYVHGVILAMYFSSRYNSCYMGNCTYSDIHIQIVNLNNWNFSYMYLFNVSKIWFGHCNQYLGELYFFFVLRLWNTPGPVSVLHSQAPGNVARDKYVGQRILVLDKAKSNSQNPRTCDCNFFLWLLCYFFISFP